jgi:hypothetical protein
MPSGEQVDIRRCTKEELDQMNEEIRKWKALRQAPRGLPVCIRALLEQDFARQGFSSDIFAEVFRLKELVEARTTVWVGFCTHNCLGD